MIMNASMGTLMVIQNKPILAFQQAVSLCFVVYGFITAIKVSRGHNAHKTINAHLGRSSLPRSLPIPNLTLRRFNVIVSWLHRR